MIDLVTNFKKIIDKSTENTIVALEEIFKDVNVEKNRLFIRNISKYYMAMAIWNNNIKKSTIDERVGKLLDNILLDYCSIVNNIIVADEKVLNFLYRNIIESVLRVISLEFESKEIDSLFNAISRNFRNENEKIILEAYSSLLKSIYNDNCLYIHTDVNKIPDNLTNLIHYYINGQEFDMTDLIKKFDNLNIAILCIFQIKYHHLFITFKSNARGLIDEIIPLKNRMKLNEIGI